MTLEYPPYRFSALEQFTHEDVKILNQVYGHLCTSDTIARMLKSVGETLLSYDIYNMSEIEIGLLVRPVGEVGKPEFHRLQQSLISIGRTPGNDLALKSPLVSKKHAEIVRRGSDFFLKDHRSNNGTHLNRVKLNPGSEVLLKNDDVINIDPFEIVVGLSLDVAKRPLDLSLSGVRICKQAKTKERQGIFVQVQPSQRSAVLLLDQESARWMTQKIISGQKDTTISSWTEIEIGLLEYLTCRILSVLNPFLQNSRLLIESVVTEESGLQEWFSKQKKVVELTFATETEIGKIYASLYLPDPAAEDWVTRGNGIDFLEKAPWIRDRKYLFCVQLGLSLLSADQIPALEEGDIILLDRTEISLEGNLPKGKVKLQSQHLKQGSVHGSLSCDGKGNSSITVEAFYQEGLKSMTEANKKTEEGGGAGEVLSSMEIPVTVEFARLSFTLEEVSSIKEGQIIELEKLQPELVDLSVDGKVIANGRLVDVEGKMGVRIQKIVKRK